jgi:hypothetical protein
MSPTPKCVLDRSRPCTSCIAPDPQSCPYPYLLADQSAEAQAPQAPAPGATAAAATTDARAAAAPQD